MRSPLRIEPNLRTVASVWHLMPDMRLGQLLLNAYYETGAARSPALSPLFYMEDSVLLDGLRKLAECLPPDLPESPQ